MQDEKNKTGNNIDCNVSDAELDALLAEWAEGEMEPPVGFHEQTMKRLRAEVQPNKKKNNIVSLFAKNKRWTSIAAAAVLMLFCVPVVQGQLGGDATQSVPDTMHEQQLQVAQDNSRARMMERDDNETDAQPQSNDEAANTAADKAVNDEKQDNNEDKKQNGLKETVMSSVIDKDTSKHNDVAANEQKSTENKNELLSVPMMASLDDENDAAPNGRMTYAVHGDNKDEGKTLEELEQELEELQEQLAQYQAQLDKKPDDTNLQLIISEQQKAIDDVKEQIEEQKKAEAKN